MILNQWTKHFWIAFILLFAGASGYAQTQATQGFCSTGGASVVTQGMKSTTAVQVSYPKCLVTVYLTGTTTKAAIFSNGSGGVLGNPFTANTDASWIFFAATSVGYDIVMSGGTPVPFPAPFTLVDVVLGGSGGSTPTNPGGVNTELQLNLNTTAFGGAGLFKSISGNPKFSANTYFTANPLALSTLNGTSPYGGAQFSNRYQCMQNAIFNGGNGGHLCLNEIDTHVEEGWNVGNPSPTFGNAGWTVNKLHSMEGFYYTSGITQMLFLKGQFNKEGDDAAIYAYCLNQGGWVDISGEGHTCAKFNGGEPQEIYGGAVAAGFSGTGLSTITVTDNSTSNGQLLVDGYVENISVSPLATGQIIGITSAATNVPGQFTTTDTHPLSFAIGSTNGAINIIQPSVPGYTTVTVSVHVTGGSNVAGGFTTADSTMSTILFACDNFPDWVKPTAITPIDGSGNQDITASFKFGHPTGCKVFQGGPQGLIDLVADRLVFASKDYVRTGYLIAGAEDATHLSYRFYTTGFQAVIPEQSHNFGLPGPTSTQTVNLTRTGGTVKGCSVGFRFVGTPVQIAATDTTFNGTFTSSNMDTSGCVTWANAGSDGSTNSAVMTTGGAVGGMSSTGAYFVWPAARVISTNYTTSVVNGATTLTPNAFSFNLYPNNMPVAFGNQIIEPHDPANKTSMLSAIATYTTAPNQGIQNHFFNKVTGSGVQGFSFRGEELVNTNNITMYLGGGGNGKLAGPVGHRLVGSWGWNSYSDAPLPNGWHDWIDTNLVIKQNVTWSGYFPRGVAQSNGNAGYSEFYDPNTGIWTVQAFKGSSGCKYVLNPNPIGADFTSCPITTVTQATADNSTKVATDQFVKNAIAAAAPVTLTGTPSTGMVPIATSASTATWQSLPPAAAGTLTGATLAAGVTASSLITAAGGTFQPTAFTSGGLTTSFTITTTTGTCTFGYTVGLLTTKTGSC